MKKKTLGIRIEKEINGGKSLNTEKGGSRAFKIGKALLISLLFIAVSVVIGLNWETNDDPGIAFLLSRQGNSYSPFQWRVLSIIISGLYTQFPGIDWWAVCSVFAIWISAFVCAYIIYQKYPQQYAFLIICTVYAFLWFVALYRLNFTRTAMSVAMAGSLLIMDGIFPVEGKKILGGQYVIGCILLLFGASIRQSCAILALGFLAVQGGIKLLSDQFVVSLNWIRSHKYQIFTLCMTAVVFLGAVIFHKVILTDEQREYERYNNLRASIQDYASKYPTYEEAENEYLAIGIDENARNMLVNWFSEDTEVLTVETLEKFSELATEAPSFSAVIEMLDGHKLVTVVVLVLTMLLLRAKKENLLRSITVIITALFCCMYLALRGRLPARVYMSILWAVVCSVIFLSGKDDNEEIVPFWLQKIQLETCSRSKLVYLLAKLTVVGSILVLGALFWRGGNLIAVDNGSNNVAKTENQRAYSRQMFDCIDEDQEHLYIFDLLYEPASMSSAFSFGEVRPVPYCENRISLGGWNVRHPYNVNILERYGIDNPVRALYERTDVYSTYSPRLLDYMQSYYDDSITVSEVGYLNGIPLVQYTAAIDDMVAVCDESRNVMVNAFEYFCTTSTDVWFFSATVEAIEENTTGIFFCNLTINDTRRTFRLNYEDGMVSAYWYGISPDFNSDDADIRIFEKTQDGRYIAYSLNKEIG